MNLLKYHGFMSFFNVQKGMIMKKIAGLSFARILPVVLVGSALMCSCGKKPEEPVKPDNEQVNQEKTSDVKAEEKKEAAVDDVVKPAEDEYVVNIRSHANHSYKTIEPHRNGLEENPLLTEIPNNNFYMLASSGNFILERPDVEDFFRHISTLVMAGLSQVKDSNISSPYEKATWALFRGIFRSFSPQKLRSLGLMGDKSHQFAFYFVRQTPVLKVALEDGEKFRQIVESYWEQNKVETRRAENISAQWILVRIDENSPMELAIRWDEHRVTMTVVSSMEHAGQVIPDLMMHPFEGHTGLDQLKEMEFSSNAAVVGVFDFTMMLNQFVQIQETMKNLSGKAGAEFDRDCVKDFRRIATNIPRVGLQVEMVSGGEMMGVDLKLKFELRALTWIKDLLAWKPKRAEFEKTPEMPMAEGYVSFPMPILLAGAKVMAEDIKREPFTCEMLTSLNSIQDLAGDLDGENEQMSLLLDGDHHIGAVMHSSSFDSNPLLGAVVYHSDKAARILQSFGVVQSDKLAAKMAEEKKAEEEAEANKDPKAAKIEDVAENEEEIAKPAEDIVVYDDAKLTELSELKNVRGIGKYLAYMADNMVFISDRNFIKQAENLKFTDAPSLLHIQVSEDLIGNDKDDERDYIVGVDVSTSKKTLDVTLRYAIK